MAGRVEALLSEDAGRRLEYRIEHLYELLKPDSLAVLAQALTWLTKQQYLDRIYRVVAPSGAGLKDFDSLVEIPDNILDEVDSGEEIPVTEKNVEVIYRVR